MRSPEEVTIETVAESALFLVKDGWENEKTDRVSLLKTCTLHYLVFNAFKCLWQFDKCGKGAKQLLGMVQKFFNTKLIFRLFITVTVDSNKKTDG